MPQCLEARAPMNANGKLSGTPWVRHALQRLIGDVPALRAGGRRADEVSPADAMSIVDRLTQTLKKQVDPRTGRTTFALQQPTLVIDGGATGLERTGGALAALYEKTSRTAEEAIAALERIEPLDPHADRDELRATTAIVRSSLEALVREVRQDPRPFQMESLFRSLLDETVVAGEGAGGYLRRLQQIAGLKSGLVRRPGDYEKYTRFLLIRDSIQCLRGSWRTWATGDQAGELGTQYVRAGWIFQAVRETVACYRQQLDQFCLGDATRWTLPVSFPVTQDSDHPVEPLSLEAFLDLVDSEAARWRQLLNEGGTVAVPAIRGFVQNIHGLVRRAVGDLSTHPDAVHETRRRSSPVKAEAPTPQPYEIFKADRLRAAFDVAQRLAALLQEADDALQPADAHHYPPASEQNALS